VGTPSRFVALISLILSYLSPFYALLLSADFSFGSGSRQFLSVVKGFRCCRRVWKSFRSGTPFLEFVKATLIVIQQGNKEQLKFNYHSQLLIVDVCE
jgi:hypothetical protein